MVQKSRNPNVLKRPLAGFYHFYKIGQIKVKTAYPNLTVRDISKELTPEHTLILRTEIFLWSKSSPVGPVQKEKENLEDFL